MDEAGKAEPQELKLKWNGAGQHGTAGARQPEPLRAGDACPQCGQGRLDYDGLLNLTCPICKFAVGGCFT